MNEHDIRVELHRILDAHNAALGAVRAASRAMQDAFKAHERLGTSLTEAFEGHDVALVSAIEANRAALKLLNRLMDEGTS